MKSLKTKVLLSAFVLFFALVATIGSTYAWFTVSSTVAVSSLELNITTAESLLIKVAPATTAINASPTSAELTPSNYTTALTSDNFDPTGLGTGLGYSLATWTMSPVTTVETDYSGVLANAFNVIGGTTARALTATTDFNSTSGYAIQLKFWVMAQTDATLKLATQSVTGTSGSGTVNTAVQNSMRLAITSTGNTNGKIFGTDMDYDYSFAGTSLAAIPAITDTNFNLISEYSTYVLDSGVAFAASVTAANGADGATIQTLTANVPVVVFVTIYLEGWDAEATQDVAAAPMTVAFNFTIL
ncbi:MAG: hypothetical protein KJ971_04290 [Firmicutes bacterium]|nr:hypothetical protein [Bacillota bacterium]